MPPTLKQDLVWEIVYMSARVEWLRNLHRLAMQHEQPTEVLASIHSAIESTKDACNSLHRAKAALEEQPAGEIA